MPEKVRALIRTMSRESPLWGAPQIHGELLKQGVDIGETSVSKYLVRRCRPPSQTWRTFLDNHVNPWFPSTFLRCRRSASNSCMCLWCWRMSGGAFCIFGVTGPTAEWTAQQLRKAFPWETASVSTARPRSDLRGGLREAGEGNGHQTGALGAPIALAPLCGAGDRHHSAECLDHVIVFSGERPWGNVYVGRNRRHLMFGQSGKEPVT